jgi:hypothetical protein
MVRRPATNALIGMCAYLALSFEAHAQRQDPWAIPAGGSGGPARVRLAAPDVAGPIGFTEPEFPTGTLIDSYTLSSLNGVPIGAATTFGYTVSGSPSTNCRIALGPPPQSFVNPPGIEGGSLGGQLTLDFGQDVNRIAFGFAFSCGLPDTPSMTVTPLDAGGGTVGTGPVTVTAISTGPFFVENQVLLNPGALFRRVRVDINAAPGTCPRFLLDNLAYPPLVTPVELQSLEIE